MRQVVVFDGLEEFTVRPQAVFDEYIHLFAQDIAAHFADRSDFVAVSCPGCETSQYQPAFTKLTFAYVGCQVCGSVFVTPRPGAAALRAFMADSAAIRFWRNTVEEETARARARSILQPRAAWIQAGMAGMTRGALVDLFSKSPPFLELIARSGVFAEVISVAPAVDPSALSTLPGLRLEPDPQTAVAAGVQGAAVSALECLDRDPQPDQLVDDAAALLRSGGLLFLTTVTWSGFDLQVLGGRAKNILPPVHLNLLTLEGIRRLLARHGFQIVELSTPGQLDTEIVTHTVAEDPDIQLPPFVDELIRRRGAPIHRAFQQFLQEALLSSHVRLIARKVEARGGA